MPEAVGPEAELEESGMPGGAHSGAGEHCRASRKMLIASIFALTENKDGTIAPACDRF